MTTEDSRQSSWCWLCLCSHSVQHSCSMAVAASSLNVRHRTPQTRVPSPRPPTVPRPSPTTDFTAYQTNGAVLYTPAPTCGSGVTTVYMKRTITATFPLGLGPWNVIRSATARWGTIGGATTAPVVVSQCTFDLATNNGTTFPSAEVVIPLGAGGPTCPGQAPRFVRLARHRSQRAVFDPDNTQLQRAACCPRQHRQRQRQPVGLPHPGRSQRVVIAPDLRRLVRQPVALRSGPERWERQQQLLPAPRLRRAPDHRLEPPTRQP